MEVFITKKEEQKINLNGVEQKIYQWETSNGCKFEAEKEFSDQTIIRMATKSNEGPIDWVKELKPGRKKLPDHLKRKGFKYYLTENEKKDVDAFVKELKSKAV